jgi:hypothetical protein
LPPASTSLRLLAFTVPVVLAVCAVQPLMSAAAGQVSLDWSLELSAPCLMGAGLLFVAARFTDRPGDYAPPWYSAWVLLPGAFLLAGTASMCIFAAFIEMPVIRPIAWGLLALGAVAWAAALAWVRRAAS